MKILFVGAEAVPFISTGGLGDVLGSLPTAITQASGGKVDVRVVMPLYGAVSAEWRKQMTNLRVSLNMLVILLLGYLGETNTVAFLNVKWAE